MQCAARAPKVRIARVGRYLRADYPGGTGPAAVRDVSNRGESGAANQDRDGTVENQQLPAQSRASTPTPSPKDGGDAHDPTQSGVSRGMLDFRFRLGNINIDNHWSKTEAGLIGPWGVPRLWSISRRGQPKHLRPSKPSWNPSRFFTPNIRSV